jgi:opacity protein-like surface antigen
MKKLLALISALILISTISFAQTGDYKKGEVFLGYSNGQVDTGLDSEELNGIFRDNVFDNFNGFNVSGVYNLNRYFGVKADVSGTYNKTEFRQSFNAGGGSTVSLGVDAKTSLYNFLGGVQVKDNSNSGRFKPFAHALVGAGHFRARVSNFTCTPAAFCPPVDIPDETVSETGLAGAFGGGIDIRLTNRVQIRAIQIDYNPIRADGATSHNLRFGFGIVF